MPYCTNCGREVTDEAAFCPHCGTPTRRAPGAFPPTAPTTPTVTLRHSSIGDRFVAVLIDSIIVGVLAFLVSLPFNILAFIFTQPFGIDFPLFLWSPFGLLSTLLSIAYFSYFEGTSGQTFGKRVMGIRVVDMDTGGGIDMGRGLVRNILRAVDMLPFLYIIGLLLISTNPRRQRLGDIVARTIVIKA